MATGKQEHGRRSWPAWRGRLLSVGLLVASGLAARAASDPRTKPAPAATKAARKAKLRAELKRVPHKIVYESYRGNTWELVMMNADGSAPVNLTRKTDLNALYPHASADGKRICFVADEGKGESKSRNVYYMKVDGTGLTLVAKNTRQPCWRADGRAVAYVKGEFARFTYKDFASKGLFIYDPDSREHRQHPNRSLHHLYGIVWSPDGKWVLATVHGGMGYRHANLAIEAQGAAVFNLKPVEGCRPDVSPDGKKIAWNATDQLIAVADLDLRSSPPKVTNVRQAVTCDKQHEVYHADWSPDGRYIAFAHGPLGPEQVGKAAKGWNICVADATETNVWVPLTSDGASNKEPDWVPAGGTKGR